MTDFYFERAIRAWKLDYNRNVKPSVEGKKFALSRGESRRAKDRRAVTRNMNDERRFAYRYKRAKKAERQRWADLRPMT